MKKFNELVKVKLSDERSVIISEKDGNLSIAQKIKTTDGRGGEMDFYMKNAILCSPDKVIEIAESLIAAAKKVKNI